VLHGESSRVRTVLATSAIHATFGRDPQDPAHAGIFFHAEEGARVWLRAGKAVSSGPGRTIAVGRAPRGGAGEIFGVRSRVYVVSIATRISPPG
jgi:hypothetical protein